MPLRAALLCAAALLLSPPGAGAALTLSSYSNTALAGAPASTVAVPTLQLALPGGSPLSAEVSGTLSPRAVSNASRWSFRCRFEHVTFAFVRIDGHVVCQHGAYNTTGAGLTDGEDFRLASKQSGLVVSAQIYHMAPSPSPAVAELRWCEGGDAARCELLPAAALSPVLPAPERQRRAMQRRMAAGWGSWLHRDALSIALLPDSAVLTVMLCRISSGECLRGANIDGNGGARPGSAHWDPTHPVRVGSHAMNHSYSQLWAWGPPLALRQVNVSIEYAVGPAGSERQLDVVVTPAPQHSREELKDFAVAFAGSFAWGRVGTVEASGRSLRMQGYGLGAIELTATAAVLPKPLPKPGVVPPGLLRGMPCAFGHNSAGDKDCASNRCEAGKCTAPQTLPHLALSLGDGAVALSTHANATLAGVQQRVAARAAAEQRHHARFGADHTELVEALGAAVSWRHIYVPAEEGTVMPVTYGFSWITPGPLTNDWRYILFCWDNIFGSYIAGVLGYKEAAYSNLIGIVTAKANDGFVPNWAAGGSKNDVSEPAVGSRVLLDLYRRFGDLWIVELLFDHLLDWNRWLWTRRRVVGAAGTPCEEPGFLTVGNDYQNCTTNISLATNCPGGGESGLDQSPLWDCPDAAPSGAGGNCSVLFNPSSHLLQLADVQSTSLFVMDAESLATLADVLGRSDAAAELRSRAAVMRAQLAKTWDEDAQTFADIYVSTGAFSDRLTPNAFYPLLARAATAEQATAMVEKHLLNPKEFCISDTYETDGNDNCYWGLPSIAANAPQFMQPQSYIYWRGLSWGPMTMLTWWSLDAYRNVSTVRAARTTLAKQKTGMMMSMWRRNRHICENYSPYAPDSSLVPGTSNGGERNTECTGWQFCKRHRFSSAFLCGFRLK